MGKVDEKLRATGTENIAIRAVTIFIFRKVSTERRKGEASHFQMHSSPLALPGTRCYVDSDRALPWYVLKNFLRKISFEERHNKHFQAKDKSWRWCRQLSATSLKCHPLGLGMQLAFRLHVLKEARPCADT